jgi:cyclopropane-fatty-acyl-phospholipid synthase
MLESGYVPDVIIRSAIRFLNRKRLALERRGGVEALSDHQRQFLAMLRQSPVAVMTDAANEQHYEVPPEFFQLVLGTHRKYSCCYYPSGAESLDEAEEKMLALTSERAQITDGMDILELGCGWGSLTLWMAERYHRSRITAVSNSTPQREFIMALCRERGIGNVEVITADMNHFDVKKRFDRIVSVEMFEHMRNYEQLLRKISSWLKPDGRLFVHIFCHREYAYLFETEGADNWMGRYFFTGGIMPSDHLLLYFQNDVVIEDHWRVSGVHYEQTANHWLTNMDSRKEAILSVLERTYGKGEATRWFQRWRIFFMACAELWGVRDGQEWWVAHYRFRKRGD